ncbi:MAG TPA: AAA family ATPase, partial [Candidatus Sulfopaludibacter sp.]|nr:AAA family ATPase [Candidatus Sulfopaludibacter sp.]
YLPDRQLPDKAVSVLDTACARLALGQNATPGAIEDATRRIDDLAVQQRVLERESNLGADHAERLGQIAEQQTAAAAHLTALQSRWEQERTRVGRLREIGSQLEQSPSAPPQADTAPSGAAQAAPALDPEALRGEMATLTAELEALQGDSPLIRVWVDSRIVGDVVSAWTGIPVGKMMRDEVESVLSLDSQLGKRVIGQSHALAAIAERIRTSKAGLEDPSKPVGVFLLVGPSGVGKTETALALSDLLYGGERNLITINMSEFQEAHTVSTLKGSPPGYVGYGEGGVLTEAVRRRPYSVVLLDEVEKAHPDVLELFFQVFDKAAMEDGEGRQIDFKNTIILLTSNAGTDTIMKLTADAETMPSVEGLAKALKPDLNKIFKPAFLGRLVVIPYFPVRDENLKRIVSLKLAKIQRRIQETHRVSLTYDEALVDEVARRCTEVESGARNVDNILTNTLMPEISRQILGRMAQRQDLLPIHAGVGEGGKFVYS